MRIIIENAEQRDFNELAKLARAGKIHDFCITDENECEKCTYRIFTEKFVDSISEVMALYGITSIEELQERLQAEMRGKEE